ncbi:MAG: glycosyltransferase family 2 protein [Pseudomonadota bacterium]
MMIPVFNTGQYLGGAVESVLAQATAPGEMQICVVDDASTDLDVKALVDSVGQGRVEYFRHPRNIGSVANFNSCLQLARGHWVHLLHADDQVMPGFYSALGDLLTRHPEAGAAFSRHRYIDAEGHAVHVTAPELTGSGLIADWLGKIAVETRLQVASIAVRRSVYEELGGFFGVSYGEDWEMWVRIACRYPFAYTSQTLADYRVHPASISGGKLRSGAAIDDLLWVVGTTSLYLPDGMRKSVRAKALGAIAVEAVRNAGSLWHEGAEVAAVRRQLSRARSLGCPPRLWWPLLKLQLKVALGLR